MARPKQRTPELKARILEVAVAIVERGGVGALTARSVAAGAQTSTAAVYELFGDKQGLLRSVLAEGFRQAGAHVRSLPESGNARADLAGLAFGLRDFLREQPDLGRVMFSHPFAAVDPGAQDQAAAASLRTAFTDGVQRGLDAAGRTGDAADIAHAVVGTVQGLWSQEHAGWLGTSAASIERRWQVAVDAVVDGALGPPDQS